MPKPLAKKKQGPLKLIGKARDGAGPVTETPALPDYDAIYRQPETDARRKRALEAKRVRIDADAKRHQGSGFHGAPDEPQIRAKPSDYASVERDPKNLKKPKPMKSDKIAPKTFIKKAGHKYIKREPDGVDAKGHPKYRYFYADGTSSGRSGTDKRTAAENDASRTQEEAREKTQPKAEQFADAPKKHIVKPGAEKASKEEPKAEKPAPEEKPEEPKPKHSEAQKAEQHKDELIQLSKDFVRTSADMYSPEEHAEILADHMAEFHDDARPLEARMEDARKLIADAHAGAAEAKANQPAPKPEEKPKKKNFIQKLFKPSKKKRKQAATQARTAAMQQHPRGRAATPQERGLIISALAAIFKAVGYTAKMTYKAASAVYKKVAAHAAKTPAGVQMNQHAINIQKSGPLQFIGEDKMFKGEARGGKYFKRVPAGTDKHGKLKYRYFYSEAEYKQHTSKHHVGGDKKAAAVDKMKEAVDKDISENGVVSPIQYEDFTQQYIPRLVAAGHTSKEARDHVIAALRTSNVKELTRTAKTPPKAPSKVSGDDIHPDSLAHGASEVRSHFEEVGGGLGTRELKGLIEDFASEIRTHNYSRSTNTADPSKALVQASMAAAEKLVREANAKYPKKSAKKENMMKKSMQYMGLDPNSDYDTFLAPELIKAELPSPSDPLRKGLYEYRGQTDGKLPDEYLSAYLDAFLRDAIKCESYDSGNIGAVKADTGELSYEYGTDTVEAACAQPPGSCPDLATIVFNTAIRYAVSNPNLLRALRKVKCDVNYIQRKIDETKGIAPMPQPTMKSIDAAFAAAEDVLAKAGQHALAPRHEVLVTLPEDDRHERLAKSASASRSVWDRDEIPFSATERAEPVTLFTTPVQTSPHGQSRTPY